MINCSTEDDVKRINDKINKNKNEVVSISKQLKKYCTGKTSVNLMVNPLI